MTFGKPLRMRRRPETRTQRAIREAKDLERVPEEVLTDDERATLRAYADYENNAFDRATDRLA